MSILEEVPEVLRMTGVDADKATRYSKTPEALETPVILLEAPLLPEFFLIDGAHRMAALKRNGAQDFTAYVLSPHAEDAYRVPNNDDAVALALAVIEASGGSEAFKALVAQACNDAEEVFKAAGIVFPVAPNQRLPR